MTGWLDDRMTRLQDGRMTGSFADDWPYGIWIWYIFLWLCHVNYPPSTRLKWSWNLDIYLILTKNFDHLVLGQCTVDAKVKTSTICRLHLCIGTTCEINLVRPAVLTIIGLLSLSSFHCQIPLKIKTGWQEVSQIFISAVSLVTGTGCEKLCVCRLVFHASGVHS